MALKNIAFCLRYTSRERLLVIKHPLNQLTPRFVSTNERTNSVYRTEILHLNGITKNDFQFLYRRYYPSILFLRSLSVNGPRQVPEVTKSGGIPNMPPIEPDKIAQVVQDIQNSTLMSTKTMSFDNQTKKVNSTDNHTKPTSSVVKISLKQKIKNELIHYYHGFRLLFLDVKIASGILLDLFRGHSLTRRERKQLVRTASDLFRMVPFAVFIVVPFMEFLLPVYIKFFPFMMPSTFKEKSKEAEKMHQLLKGKLEMAKFLQDTLDETRNTSKYKADGDISLETFNSFMKEARESGNTAGTDDILKFSRLFEDEVTLESLDHKQVKALCKLLDINSIGPKALLSFHLRMRVHQLKVDDKMIMKEGMSKIPAWELQQLCRERGMRAIGVSEERLRYQLKQWLKLSVESQVPISLLLLSRTMYLPESLSAEEQLTKTILILPQSVSKEASLLTSSASTKFDNKTMFELIKEEEIAIREEKDRIEKETLVDKALTMTLSSDDTDVTLKGVIEGESVSASDMAQLETAIESMEGSHTSLQEEELDELKEQAAESLDTTIVVPSANKLSKKLQNMIQDMESLLDRLDTEKETLMKGAELSPGAGGAEERMVAIKDLMSTLRQLKSVSHDEDKWRRILEMLDEDHDGHIEVHHVMEVLELMEGSDLSLSTKELGRVLAAIDKEEVMDEKEASAGGAPPL